MFVAIIQVYELGKVEAVFGFCLIEFHNTWRSLDQPTSCGSWLDQLRDGSKSYLSRVYKNIIDNLFDSD